MSASVPSDDPEPVSDESASLLTVLSGTAAHAPFGNFLGSPATAAPQYVPSPPRAQAAMAPVPANADPYSSFQQISPQHVQAAKARVPAAQDSYFSFQGPSAVRESPPLAQAAKPRAPAPQDAYFVGYGSYQAAPPRSHQTSPSISSARPDYAAASTTYSAQPVHTRRDDACDECIGICLSALCQALCFALCEAALRSRH